ncbi:MAG TPA: hypothetical protein VFH70_01490 [Acidimicrobiales bacterium]|nr:hypothetical protein [Acidimicrobiales bacterium]
MRTVVIGAVIWVGAAAAPGVRAEDARAAGPARRTSRDKPTMRAVNTPAVQAAALDRVCT